MDSHHLKAFLIVAETGSFSQAALKLHLTQPAISKRIATLESQLDCRLFDRISRQVRLTEAGRTLLERARRILAEIEDTQRALHDLTGDVRGQLNIATSHHLGLHRLPPVLRTFSERYPKVSLDIHFVDSESAYSALAKGKIELGIITLAPETPKPLVSEEIWADPMVFMAAPDHPLACSTGVSSYLLSQHPAILPDSHTFTHRIIRKAFDAIGQELNISLSTNYLETIKMMTSVGLGWTVLPESMQDDTLVKLPVNEITLSRSLGFIYHRERTLSNAASAMIALLKEAQKNQR